jgi:hypothetical protein
MKQEQLKGLTFITDNLRNYLAEVQHIGFTQEFPETKAKPIDEEIIEDECMGVKVKFSVRLTKLKFGDGKYEVTGIVTDKVDISSKLRMGGWGSHSYHYVGKMLEAAVAKMCLKHNVFVSKKICTWPFAKVVVGEVTPVHEKCFNEKLKESVMKSKTIS